MIKVKLTTSTEKFFFFFHFYDSHGALGLTLVWLLLKETYVQEVSDIQLPAHQEEQ